MNCTLNNSLKEPDGIQNSIMVGTWMYNPFLNRTKVILNVYSLRGSIQSQKHIPIIIRTLDCGAQSAYCCKIVTDSAFYF